MKKLRKLKLKEFGLLLKMIQIIRVVVQRLHANRLNKIFPNKIRIPTKKQ